MRQLWHERHIWWQEPLLQQAAHGRLIVTLHSILKLHYRKLLGWLAVLGFGEVLRGLQRPCAGLWQIGSLGSEGGYGPEINAVPALGISHDLFHSIRRDLRLGKAGTGLHQCGVFAGWQGHVGADHTLPTGPACGEVRLWRNCSPPVLFGLG